MLLLGNFLKKLLIMKKVFLSFAVVALLASCGGSHAPEETPAHEGADSTMTTTHEGHEEDHGADHHEEVPATTVDTSASMEADSTSMDMETSAVETEETHDEAVH